MRVLICGSRNWPHVKPIKDVVDSLPPNSTVINGGASGADWIAKELAEVKSNLKVETIYARWDLYGKFAGPKRNIELLDREPDIVYAFPLGESRGTMHTVNEARKRGIEVIVYE